MAGAYTAYAEGIDGAAVNAASPAVREPFSYDWFDYDIDVDFSLPGAYGGTDFDNRGPSGDPRLRSTVDGFLYAHAGAQLQLGELGISASGEYFQYGITPSSGGAGLTLAYGRYHALAAYGLFGNQLVAGAGLRIVTVDLSEGANGGGQSLVTLDGAGPEAGVVVKPDALPFRLGATARAPVQGTVAGLRGFFTAGASGPAAAPGVTQAAGFILPSRAALPWEVDLAFAYQLGPRPLNPPWLDPHAMERPVRDRIDADRARRAHDDALELSVTPPASHAAVKREQALREQALRVIEDERLDAEKDRLYTIRVARELNWPRERITLLGSLLVTGASNGAVSLEGFAAQTRDAVGQHVTFTPRAGIESEPVPNWVHARVGSYLEPSRFEDGTSRQHFTFGGDVRLIPFSPWGIFGDQIWRISFSADLAPRYQNFGIGLGAWH